jgi:hypothetical protein
MRLNTRSLLSGLGLIGAVWIAGQSIADGPLAPKSDAVPAKKEHQTVVALRDRIMTEFHGRTANIFTTVPGFGMERMMPVYERIPWEVPHFSTNDVEVEQAPATPKMLKDLFAKSLEAFEKREAAKEPKAKPIVPAPAADVFVFIADPKSPGRVQGQTIIGGIQLRMLDLIGSLDPAQPKIYSGGKAFELVRSKNRFGGGLPAELKEKAPEKDAKKDDNPHFGTAEDRPLDLFESIGLNELIDGKETFIRTKDNVVRMLGALRASESCLKCHTEHKRGDVLGAFSYTFVDTGRVLTKAQPADQGGAKVEP